jgi:hypothetical protein
MQVVYLGLGFATRNLVIVAGTYQIDPVFWEKVIVEQPGWLIANVHQEARVAFRDVAAEFREHAAVVEITPHRVVVTVLVKNRVDLRPMFESLGRRLDELVRERQRLPPGAPGFKLTDLELKRYPWFRPLDIVSLVVLLGAVGAWVFLP